MKERARWIDRSIDIFNILIFTNCGNINIFTAVGGTAR